MNSGSCRLDFEPGVKSRTHFQNILSGVFASGQSLRLSQPIFSLEGRKHTCVSVEGFYEEIDEQHKAWSWVHALSPSSKRSLDVWDLLCLVRVMKAFLQSTAGMKKFDGITCWWGCAGGNVNKTFGGQFGHCYPQLSQWAWTVITKHHRLGGRDNRQLFLAFLEAGKSEFRVASQLGSLSDLLMAAFLPYPHTAQRQSTLSALFL